jgi:hypothetical protein
MGIPRARTTSHRIWLLASLLVALPAFAQEQGTEEDANKVQERAVQQPYTCSPDSGVCLCFGQANCDQLTQPKPCKRPKLCLGQTVAQPPPPTGQEVPSMARTITTNFMVCSCRVQ